MIKPGLIVSIQGYSHNTTFELAMHAVKGGAVAIRTDCQLSFLEIGVPVIQLEKKEVNNRYDEAYITPNIEAVKRLKTADLIAIDYRKCNKDLESVSWYCAYNKIPVVADIRNVNDFVNIKNNNYYFSYIATTFSVFDKPANYNLIADLKNLDSNVIIIAEGGYNKLCDVNIAYNMGADYVCIGSAISNIQNLTKEFSANEFDN